MTGTSVLPLERRIRIAGLLVERARVYLDLFEFYEDVETRPFITEVLEDYHFFFRLEHHVHRLAFLLKIAGLFKRKNGTVNLPRLLDEARGRIKQDEWNKLKALIEGCSSVSDKAEFLRNKAIGHRDMGVDHDEAYKLANVTRNELKSLSDTSLVIVNALERSVGQSETVFMTRETRAAARRVFNKLGASFPEPANRGAYDELFGDN